MHTLMMIGGGVLLLAGCLAIGYLAAGTQGARQAALIFLPLWLIGAGINLYVGVSRAGYTVAEELPILLIVFGVPALLALAVRWMLR